MKLRGLVFTSRLCVCSPARPRLRCLRSRGRMRNKLAFDIYKQLIENEYDGINRQHDYGRERYCPATARRRISRE